MTLQQFIDYVATFKKQPGTYTKDEQYQIALVYKQLTHYDKERRTWKWLLFDLLGATDRSPDGFRSWVNKRYNKELLNVAKGRVFNDETYKLDIAKIHNRDYLNAIRRNNRDEARLNELKQLLQESIARIPQLPSYNIKTNDFHNDKTAILLLSDWHIGQENDNFAGKFNYEIAKQRVEQLCSQVLEYTKLHKISRLEILLLGDFFEGVINISARIEQEMDVCTQLVKSTELICQALNHLQYAARVVTVRGCTDNHSRMYKDLSMNLTKENLFRIQEWMIKERMKGSKIKFPDDNLSEYLGMFKLECGKVVAFEHGHLFSKNLSLQALLPAKKGTWIDIVCLGHYHNSCVHQYQGMKVYCNGSLTSGNTYANEKHLFSMPEQKLLIVDNNNIIDIDIGFNV